MWKAFTFENVDGCDSTLKIVTFDKLKLLLNEVGLG